MKKIIIAGAGFGGLNLALRLEKKLGKQKDVSITLIDKHDYHLFNPALYEAAAADEEFTSLNQLKRNIVLPLRSVLSGRNIKFVQAEITHIDQLQKKITAGVRELEYDYLVLALGSQAEYFNIIGAEQYSLPLKSLNDAFRIRNTMEFAVQSHRNDVVKQYIRFVVAGGGYTGVELAGELVKLADILAWKNGYPREKIEILVIESTNQLVPGFDQETSRAIFQRLLDLGVQIKLASSIFKVAQHFVELATGERILFDALVWTAGVRAKNIPAAAAWPTDKRGQLKVDAFLRVQGQDGIFALGDIASIKNTQGNFLPATAQAATAEAKYLSGSLPQFLQHKMPGQFAFEQNNFVVSVGGKWALAKFKKQVLSGYTGYLVRLAANWRYYAGLIGWLPALKYVLSQAGVFGRND